MWPSAMHTWFKNKIMNFTQLKEFQKQPYNIIINLVKHITELVYNCGQSCNVYPCMGGHWMNIPTQICKH